MAKPEEEAVEDVVVGAASAVQVLVGDLSMFRRRESATGLTTAYWWKEREK